MAPILQVANREQQANLFPRIVSWEELRAKLEPICAGDRWAIAALRDLWLKGAPVPSSPGEPERRILLPNQFKKWWEDVNSRLGVEVIPDQFYTDIAQSMRRKAGEFHKLRPPVAG